MNALIPKRIFQPQSCHPAFQPTIKEATKPYALCLKILQCHTKQNYPVSLHRFRELQHISPTRYFSYPSQCPPKITSSGFNILRQPALLLSFSEAGQNLLMERRFESAFKQLSVAWKLSFSRHTLFMNGHALAISACLTGRFDQAIEILHTLLQQKEALQFSDQQIGHIYHVLASVYAMQARHPIFNTQFDHCKKLANQHIFQARSYSNDAVLKHNLHSIQNLVDPTKDLDLKSIFIDYDSKFSLRL